MDERIRKSRRQEREGQAKRGGRQTKRSGASWHSKNDGRTASRLQEYKRTDRKSITLSYKVLRDAEMNALAEGRDFEISIGLQDRSYVVITEHHYLELLRRGPDADETMVRGAQSSRPIPRQVRRPRDDTAKSVLQRPEQFRSSQGQSRVQRTRRVPRVPRAK